MPLIAVLKRPATVIPHPAFGLSLNVFVFADNGGILGSFAPEQRIEFEFLTPRIYRGKAACCSQQGQGV